ncbi:MAG TPA: M43 family zinc metalloprotease, partial [Bacteroidia bacterium]|nr:M43 family zinc metalloprotease [Bacteroidia bacterium]
MKKRLLFILGGSLAFGASFSQNLINASLPASSAYTASTSTSAYYDVSGKSMIRFNTDIITQQQMDQVNQDRHDFLVAENPNYDADRSAYEANIQQYIAAHGSQVTSQSVYTIPVVVHVVYNTTTQNISDNQVFSQIQVLNEDFGRTNADANTHWSQAANTTIQFCLAQQDPNGNATNGIERRHITTNVSFGTNDNVKHFSSNGLDAWDPTRYLNIWVCNLGSSLLGYGEFPTTSVSQTFGVVILYSAFGSNFTSYGTFADIQSPYDRGRTTTHEFSHCFNLYHIWGDDNGACTGTDYCADTPNQANATTTCYTFPHTDACTGSSPGIMFENYMDYSYDNCLNLFTNNQKSRMLAVLSTAPYNALTTSNGCQAPSASVAPVAAFTMSASSVCAGTAVNFTDNSTNSPTSWSWTFPGGSPGTSTAQNPAGITWSAAGTYTVSLTASNGSGSNTITHTITILALPSVTTSTSGATICSGSSTTITASGASTYSWMPGSLSGTTVTVSPATTTTYTVTGTNANGCTNTATRTITVNASPTVTTTASSSTVCSGTGVTLGASGASTYNWMPGNHNGQPWTTTPTSTTTYTVTGTSANGCTGTATRTITVNASPTVTTTASPSTICSS